MVILDVAIVNVALPSIKSDLGFSDTGLQWVITAYAILFGGTLLLGGRLADLLGRRRMFVAGLALFAARSLLSGFARSAGSLLAFRAVPGLGGAPLAPAAHSGSAVRRPAAARPPASCAAASSPRISAGRGSSSSTPPSASPRSRSRR